MTYHSMLIYFSCPMSCYAHRVTKTMSESTIKECKKQRIGYEDVEGRMSSGPIRRRVYVCLCMIVLS